MKKYVLFMLLVALLFVGLSVCFFCHYYNDKLNQQIVDISKIVFQSMLTGSVTFCGLFLTISSQEYQNEKQKRLERCPCIIIKDFKGLSATRDITSIRDAEKIVLCCTDCIVRTIDLTICNCKTNYCINCSIETQAGSFMIGNIKDQNEKIKIALKNEDDSLIFKFEDIYGLKYQQEIKYQYDSKTKSICFVSCQPMRRKKS